MKVEVQGTHSTVLASESIDAFMAIAGIYFDSTQRLTELTLAANRQALDDFVARSNKQSETESGLMSVQFDALHMQPAIEQALTYSRNVVEVLMQAQLNAGKILSQQLIPQLLRFPTSGEWSDAVDTFSEGVREVSERGVEAVSTNLKRAA